MSATRHPTSDPMSAAPGGDHTPAWRKLSLRLGAFVDTITPRRDLLAVIGPGATEIFDGQRPAGMFDHSAATLFVDATQVLAAAADPDRIDLRDPRDCARYPVLAGVTAHEVGHATHSARRGTMPKRAAMWASLLEEPRMEGRVVAENPRARSWLRASATHLLGPINARSADEAARMLILVGGRIDAGVYEHSDLPDLTALAGRFLSDEQVDVLVTQIRIAVGLPDGDVEALVRCAHTIADVMSSEDAEDDGGDELVEHGSDDVPVSTGSNDHAAASADADVEEELAAALAAMARRSVDQLRYAENVTALTSRAQHRRDLRRELAAQTTAAGAAARARTHRHSARRPTAAETQQSARLTRLLTRAADRGTYVRTIAQAAPPGRMNTRELVRREGQLAAGVTPTAAPWSSKRRRVVDVPPLTVGIAVDTSPSMEPVLEAAGVAAWMVRRAVRSRGGDAETMTWNSDAAVLQVNPDNRRVLLPACEGTSEGLPEALLALDARLHLTAGTGPRLVVVISDGDIPNHHIVEQHLRRFTTSGAAVLWLTHFQWVPQWLEQLNQRSDAVRVSILDDTEQIAERIGAAMVGLLQTW